LDRLFSNSAGDKATYKSNEYNSKESGRMTVRPEHNFKSKAGGSISPWTH